MFSKQLRNISQFFSSASLRYHIDFITTRQIIGWAFDGNSTTPLTIEGWVGDVCVGCKAADERREDVGADYPRSAGSRHSGFHLTLQLPQEAEEVELVLRACRKVGSKLKSVTIKSIRLPTTAGFRAAREAAAQGVDAAVDSPFPKPVTLALRRLWPDMTSDLTGKAAQNFAVERIAFLASSNPAEELPFLMDYIRFLRMTWSHFNYVGKYFPSVNLGVPQDAKDAGCKPNSIEEMYSIAHHLYVLKSHGVPGQFAEFGCFKGFSTALLSYAYDYLGIPMRVYDSFAGLPASTSSYYKAGEFRGGYEEVRRNVELFGAPRAVTYKQGFFADVIAAEEMPQLMALWMDVDLSSSAADVMHVADKIDPRGCVFSHESGPVNFVNGEIFCKPGPDDVVSSIVAHYAKSNIALTGRYMVGSTSAFWQPPSGIPVLDNSVLLDLIRKI